MYYFNFIIQIANYLTRYCDDENRKVCSDSEEEVRNIDNPLYFVNLNKPCSIMCNDDDSKLFDGNAGLKRKSKDLSGGNIKRCKRSKCELIYTTESHLKNYADFNSIPILAECKCKYPELEYLEKNEYSKLLLYETHCFKRPPILAGRTGVRSVEFKNNDSFKNCIRYAYYNQKNYKSNTRLNYLDEAEKKAFEEGKKVINFDNLKFPVNPLENEKIKKFEEDNRIGVVRH